LDKKKHILGLMDELLQSNTTSNAQLMLLYDEVEKLFKQAAEADRLRVLVDELNDEVIRLRGIQDAAVEYLKAVARNEETSGRLDGLSTALGHKVPKKKKDRKVIDPNKTMPPNFHD